MLEFRDESNCIIGEPEGFIINRSSEIIQLRSVTDIALQELWNKFETKLRSELLDLFLMPFGSVIERYGQLDLKTAYNGLREGQFFGFITQGAVKKFVHLRRRGVVQAMISLGHFPALTPHGKERQDAPKGTSVEEAVIALTMPQQRALMTEILSRDLDEVLQVTQTASIEFEATKARIFASEEPQAILAELAMDAKRFMYEQQSMPKPDEASGHGTGYIYGPMWFAQFLAAEGVWLFPTEFWGGVRNIFPYRLEPLMISMSSSGWRDVIDILYSFLKGETKETFENVKPAFAMLGLVTNMFGAKRFSSATMLAVKEIIAYKCELRSVSLNNMQSTALNKIYFILADHFSIDTFEDENSRFFNRMKQVRSSSAQPFNWTIAPTPKNTRRIFLKTGIEINSVDDVPAHVKAWAVELRSILKSYGVQAIKQVVSALDCWLMYLLTLRPEDAPVSFATIDRARHVNDFSKESPTFVNFLNEKFADSTRGIGTDAISKMAQGWVIVATRDKFASKKSKPFDVTMDKISKRKNGATKSGTTHRDALIRIVRDTLLSEHRKDDYAFARGIDRFWKKVRVGKLYETVFWPAVPLILEAILLFGLRTDSALWLDSGEGDEQWIDLEKLRFMDNPLPTATLGRQESFITATEIYDIERGKVLSAHVSKSKTGPYDPPWMDTTFARTLREMRTLVVKYCPMKAPIKPLFGRDTSEYASTDRLTKVYPIFREPDAHKIQPASRDYLLKYYVELCIHVQPLVDSLLGYHYPLVRDGKPVFDLHSLRVTTVTLLKERGVSDSAVMAMAGHKTLAMMYHYNKVSNFRVHTELSEAMKPSNLLERAASGEEAALAEISSAAYSNGQVGTAGVKKLQLGLAMHGAPPLDFFEHSICGGGDCSKGGRDKDGRAVPVWRPRACSRCAYRILVTDHIPGVARRINILAWEMRECARRSLEWATKEEEHVEKTGKGYPPFRVAKQAEDRRRELLMLEWVAENQTLRGLEDMRREAIAHGISPGSLVVSSGQDLDEEKVTLELRDVPDFGLMHILMKDRVRVPAAYMDLDRDPEPQYKDIVRKILRSNNLNDVLVQISDDESKRSLLAFGDFLLTTFDAPGEFQSLLEGAFDLGPERQTRVREVLAQTGAALGWAD